MTGVAYNPYDPLQKSFLGALAQGESGGASNAPTLGYGGTDLSGASTDQFGFPQWSGLGGSHAAGTFQFQPGTWDAIAQKYNLNFSNPGDQAAGAWYLAQETYQQKTGGDLETAIKTGDYQSIQSALSDVWPSVTGNQAAPMGLANDIGAGIGAAFDSGGYAGSSGGSSPTSAASSSSGGGIFGAIENFFVRFGLIAIGGIIIVVALWQLVSEHSSIPSPGQTASTTAKALAL